MAQIVSVVASTHNPRIFWNRDQADKTEMEVLYDTFADVRDKLAASKPDVIVAVANDHLDNFFFDQMPVFSVGTGSVVEGPFWYESEIMNLPHYRAHVHQPFAEYVLRDGVEKGIQFTRVHDLHIDHAFTLPLSFVRPAADLPIVPIMTNVFAYPIPSNDRWYAFGQFLRRTIETWPSKDRVAIVVSFNMTVEVGGPKMGNYNFDWMRSSLELMKAGKRDELLSFTVPQLIAQGNSTAEFLNYIAALGVVEDRPPTTISHKPVKGVGTCPLAFWGLV